MASPTAPRTGATLLASAADRFTPVATRSSDPAVLIYTSGTTGRRKGR